MPYLVSFRWYDTDTFCTNICIADSEIDVKARYCPFKDVSISEASDSEVEMAKRKGMPIFDIRKSI